MYFKSAELLIVVAIIFILVSILIPVFTKRLEKSCKEADLANMEEAILDSEYILMENKEYPIGAVLNKGYRVINI